jgi:DNA-directed RNA polymerase sigma subunit (sigma70/sigma32)
MVEKLNKVVHIERQLVQRLGREPRPEEIADELEMSTEEVREILRMAQLPVSLEKPIGEEGSSLGDFITDALAASPEERAEATGSRESLERLLQSLLATERRVIDLRFGLTGGPPGTLEEVARALGVTRERIRQIENQALRKLSDALESGEVPDFAQLPPEELEGASISVDELVADRLSLLDERERQVFGVRIGLERHPKSREEVAAALDLDGEDVRQIEESALEKLGLVSRRD